MKSFILVVAMLISLATSQIILTQQTMCSCIQLTNQNDCSTLPGCIWINNSCSQNNCSQLDQSQCLKASYYCQWNTSEDSATCSAFTSCQNLIATNNQECIKQNVRCLGFNQVSQQCLYYNQINSNCSDYSQNNCSYNFGKDGPCYLINNTCQVINQCSQAKNQDQCQQFNQFKSVSPQGIICQWYQNQCQTITNCNQFISEDTCKYYFTNLNTLNVCYWSINTTPPQCVSVTNLNNLNQQNCLSNTSYLFRWYGLQSNPNQGICGPCKQIQIITKTQCICSDYVLQSDCNSKNYLCQWNTQTGTCTQNNCINIPIQNDCITVSDCYWSFKTNKCQILNNCTDLTFTVNSIGCASQSLQCAGYEGGTCISTSTIVPTCSNQQSQQECSQFISNQGLCIWNTPNYSCSLLKNCNQINDSVFCVNWQNQCIWDATSSQCLQLTCSQITNQQNCTYILIQFQQTQYQLCRWNQSLGIQGGCENAYSALLQTSDTCVNNTGNTYRWSTNNASVGMCVSCGTNQLSFQTLSSCQCQQLNSQENCKNSGFCKYNTNNNICEPSHCIEYQNQITCASLSTCYWNSKNGCSSFTNCSELPNPTNQLECVNMNVQCKGFNNGVCQSYPTSTCSVMYNTNGNCYNNIGTDGVCFLSTTDQITQCIGFSECNQTQSETVCLRNQLSCQWNTLNGQCSSINCTSFKTQLNCKFYIPNLLSSQIIPCYWNTNNNTCVTASNILTQLNQNTCPSNTHNTYTWITISNTKGYCVKCQEQITLPNQCPCTFLSYNDCSQSLECYWNGEYCLQLECPQILLQTICASQLGCMWNQNQCKVFNGQCTNLLGNSQVQCMEQNFQCVGSNGIQCNKQLNNCEDNNEDNKCLTALGSDGACYWNNNTQKCVAVSSCNQLPQYACQLRSKSCYWDTISTSCQILTCSTLLQYFGQCTFVINLTSIKNIQTCELINNQCIPIQDPFNLSQDQCFSNTNRTARWIPSNYGNNGICYSCSANMIPFYSSQSCQCYQYMTQNDCYGATGQSCIWENQKCTQQHCSNIYTNQACAQTIGCGWNNSVCQIFSSCESITGQGLNIYNCLSYSIQCKGFNGKTCTQFPNNTCSSYQNQNTCNGNLGSDGPCQWNSFDKGSCSVILTCSYIKNPQICSYYQNICILIDDQCQQLTCANFNTPSSCTYIISSFLTGEIQQCQWQIETRTCVNLITSSQLNSVNCSRNTGFTYRWIPSKNQNGDGYCTKCFLKQLYLPGQCACNQLIYQNDCQANLQCSWSTTSNIPNCYNKPCSEILTQEICSSTPRCSWSASQLLCQPFSSCSNLAGVNAGECASYSIYCAAISKTFLSLQQKYICSPTTSQQCSINTETISQYECENIIAQNGICQFNSINQQCTLVTNCSQITSQLRCQQFNHQCKWSFITDDQTKSACQTAQCNQFTNKFECTYILSSLSNYLPSKVITCEWLPTQGCQQATNILTTLSSSQCYSNTLMMSRWTSTSGDSGYCASCTQYSLNKMINSPCSCSDLSSYECAYASPQCSYNQTSSKCTTSTCTSITSKYSCAANPNCIYIGTCKNYSKKPTNNSTFGCVNITTAKSPLDCSGASINCPQYIPNNDKGQYGTCNVKEQCSNFNSTTCNTYNQQVATPYCVVINTKCQTINNCKQITDIALCSLQTNRCQWSFILNSCITQSCNSYTSKSDCTYVYTSYSPGDITLCYWDSYNFDCRNASQSITKTFNQTNNIQCFVNTGHLYHLDGNDCKKCFQNILSILLITVIFIII
ncbi:unnamed protein product [Paramecium pentaurelia]|uniref:PSI domain-containing protein n=1 Tax=Paramecium pentaurelia TaxID=43138 RepID=A0A8S1YBQ4_9CILI|nr:unnamed protein product [Paramecium pentaurelia]